MTRIHSHDAFVRELRDLLRAAGASAMLEPVHIIPHLPDVANAKTKGERFIPDLEVIHLDDPGRRYLVDVTTVDVTAATHRVDASRKPGAGAAKTEGRKAREYKSKVDARTTPLFPAAIEMSGRWGEGLVSLFKKGASLATKEGTNTAGKFATLWKRRLSITARRAMMSLPHHAMRTCLEMTLRIVRMMMSTWTNSKPGQITEPSTRLRTHKWMWYTR